jgi:myo-inositol-1(or 4)-monophosphatase
MLDPLLLDDLSGVALDVAQGVAAILRHGYGKPREQVDTKSSPTDMVSEVDRAAEAYAMQRLARLRPHDGVLGEEGALRPSTSGVRWVLDPLDGTTNYLFGVPMWSVSIAAEIDERPVVGVVIDPSRDETWQATKGRGATLNGRPCRVADGRSSLSTALVATGFAYQRPRRAWEAEVVARVLPEVRDIRRFGSAALDLCWVAGGRFDAYYEWGLNPWDLSAGWLLCEEAGGRVTMTEGEIVIATTTELFDPLWALLGRAGAFDPPTAAGG